MSLKWPSCPPCVFPCDVQAARLAACSSPTAGIPGRSAWTSSRITSRTWAPRPTSWSWTSRAPRSAENWSEFFLFFYQIHFKSNMTSPTSGLRTTTRPRFIWSKRQNEWHQCQCLSDPTSANMAHILLPDVDQISLSYATVLNVSQNSNPVGHRNVGHTFCGCIDKELAVTHRLLSLVLIH